MTEFSRGFFIKSLSVVGRSKPPAQLDFVDGLTVVSGASDTGKSYALSCIDHALGATGRLRDIQAAAGYSDVVLWLEQRGTKRSFELTRALAGGDVRVREFRDADVVSDNKLKYRHAANDPGTLSYFLLSLAGFDPNARVRKNAAGDLRSVSYRDIAFLTLVDEARIIEEAPPQLSGDRILKTGEQSVFRMIVTGHTASEVVQAPESPKVDVDTAAAQLDVLRQLAATAASELEQLGILGGEVAPQLERMDRGRQEALAAYESVRVEVAEREASLAALIRDLREAEGRATVVEGLIQRFRLLDAHYRSDLQRLAAIGEAGVVLSEMPQGPCPLCGAPPEAHAARDAEEHYRVADVGTAVAVESAKIAALQADLNKTLTDLTREQAAIESARAEMETQARKLQSEIDHDIAPRMAASARALDEQVTVRDRLQRAQAVGDQLAELRIRIESLEAVASAAPPGRGKRKIKSAPTTGEMNDFCIEVERLLKAWNYPDVGRVVFSDENQDLVIGGQPRASHGKGVRALTCAAFILALMRHSLEHNRPHPGLVALDSPLVVYREPDAPGSADLQKAGVNAAFYKSLAEGVAGGQVIVFENEDPPEMLPGMRYHHFSKSSDGRYGFIPI